MKKTLVVTLTVFVALTSVFQVAVTAAPKVDDNEMSAAGQLASTAWPQLEPTKGAFRQGQAGDLHDSGHRVSGHCADSYCADSYCADSHCADHDG
jgi:hypothetical protein